MNQCLCLKRAAEACAKINADAWREFGISNGPGRTNLLTEGIADGADRCERAILELPCECQSAKIEGSERHADAMADAIKRSDFFSMHVAVADYEKWKEEK